MTRALFLWVTAAAVLGGCNCGGPGGGVAPGVRDTFPRNGNTTVSTDTDILIEFSGPMQAETVDVTFDPPVVQFGYYWTGNYLTLVRGFTNGLQPNTTYTATVVGDPEAGLPVNHTFSFTTRDEPDDQVSPTFTSTPADGAVIEDPLTPVVLTFSEPMKPDSVHVSFWRGSQGRWTWNPTFDRLEIAAPTGGFLPGSTVEVSVSGSDRWYNGFSDQRFTFSVSEPVPPLRVEGMSPPPGSTAVPQYASLSLSFSRDMEPDATAAAITVTPSNECYAGSSVWVNPRMFRCNPMNALSLGTEYTVTVGTGARDADGNALPAPFVATFTGGGDIGDSSAPTIVSHTPENFSSGNPDNTPLVITFSESMDRSTTEEEFRMLINGVPNRFAWNEDSTQLTIIPLSRYSPGFTVQWTADFSEDYFGNYIYEFTTPREFVTLGVATTLELPQRDTGSVTVGSLGGGSAELANLLVGDDPRNQSTQSFLSFDVAHLPSEGFTAMGIRQAFLSLPRVGCDGEVANLGGTLLVEAIDRGEAFDAADLETAALGEAVAVSNVCTGPDWLYVDVTSAVEAAFAARATNGGLTHFRLRFPQGSNGDGQADRVVFTSQLQLFTEPELHVIYDYVAAD